MGRVRGAVAIVGIVVGALATAQAWKGPQAAGGMPPAPPTAVILGQVVDGDTGDPVSDVTVTMAMRVAPAGRGRGAAPALPGMPPGANQVRLLTGTDGKFVVRDVPAGNVQLSATARGYVNGGHGQTRPGGPMQPFQVPTATKVAAVTIRLWRTAVITGVVTDERGEPRPGIQVRAMRRSYQRGQARLTMAPLSQLPTTDDRGVYRLSGLTPGDYVVVSPHTQMSMPAAIMESLMQGVTSGDPQGLMAVGMEFASSGSAILPAGVRVGDLLVGTQAGLLPVPGEDGRWQVYGTQFYPSVEMASQATVISLRSGEERAGVDLALPLVPTVSVSGVVIGPSGPVGNVGVRLRHAGESLVQDQSADVAATTTRADGTFHLPAVPAGNYVARVLRRPRPALPAAALAEVPAEMRAMLGAMGNQGPLDAMTLFAEMPLPLDRDVEGLTLALTTGATLSGRIVFEGAGSPPVTTNISVALTAVGGEWTSGGMPGSLGRAKEDGTFTTAGYPPGRYVVTPTGRAMAGWFPKSVLVNGRDALFEAFELEGRDLSNVVITYTDRRGTVSGTVQAPTAGADASASVIIFPVAWREWIAGGMHTQLTRLARTPAAGSFSIAGLPPREYFVVAVANTDAPDIQDPTVFEALAQLATTVSVSEGETRTITLSIVPFSRQEVLR